MGRADSPLRDRVIFVEGAPRSGTTWLVTLLATHPDIVGTQAESHLFDYGVDHLFDNLEYRHPTLRGLARYLDREQLVDLTRDLCDGIFTAMRDHVAPGTAAPFVVEKTPTSRADGVDLERKRDCYPDAWYVHVVRDREAVIRSLMRAPFMADRSREACAALWDNSVGNIRRCFGELPRYVELPYDDLRADPAAACRGLFEKLGVAAGDAELETVRALSRERFSEIGAPPPAAGPSLRELPRRALQRAQRWRSTPEPPEGSRLIFLLVRALREDDPDTIRQITGDKLEFEFRSAAGDELRSGDDARAALGELAQRVFHRRYAGESWTVSGGDGEWFTLTAGKPFWSVFFSRLGTDATRVDLAMSVAVEGTTIRRVAVITAGPLDGRPVAPAQP